MAKFGFKPGYGVAYKLLVVGYAFIVALAVICLEPVCAGVAFLSIQCLSLVFVIPACLCSRPRGPAWPKRFLEQLLRLLPSCGLTGAGAAAGLLASFVTPVPASRILLASLFALSFGIFLAGVCAAARALLARMLSQSLALAAGLLMVSTPYYVNPFIFATSGELRMRVVQAAVNINPLLVGAAGIMKFDWLRSPHLYQRCLVGGYQYPFYYPSALKTGIVLCATGIILIAISAFRKASEDENPG